MNEEIPDADARREFIRQSAAAAAGAVAGIPLPAHGAGRRRATPASSGRKAPCRFCGTGCGVTVAVKDNRVVATHGDPQAEVNRGLNCVKGYFLSKIMYGEDRLTTPLLRMKNGKYAKDGEFQRVSWDTGLRRDGRAVQARAEGEGADRGRHVRLRPVDGLGRLRGAQADEGGLPLQQPRSQRAPLHGLGRGGLHAHLRRRRADGLLRRHRGRRRLRAVGLEHGRDAPDPVDAGDRPAAERARTSRWRCCRPSSTAPTSWPTSSSPSRRRPTWRSSTTSPTTSSRPTASTASSSTSTPRSGSATPTSATACGPSIRCRRRPRTPATPAAPSR